MRDEDEQALVADPSNTVFTDQFSKKLIQATQTVKRRNIVRHLITITQREDICTETFLSSLEYKEVFGEHFPVRFNDDRIISGVYYLIW